VATRTIRMADGIRRGEGFLLVTPTTGGFVSSIQEPASRRRFAAAAAAFAFIAVLYFLRLGAGSLWDNSEPQYGEIVKEMLRSGDWLTLHKDLQPWFIHPPLWFWTAGLAGKLFGLTEFALRLPSAVFGVACCFATYLACKRLYGETAGIVAALALGVSLEFMVLARLAVQDTMLICAMTIGTFWTYFAVRDRDGRALWIACVAIAVGTMVKGPVALVLPALSVLAWAAWSKRWRSFSGLPWLAVTAAYVVLAGAWFAAQAAVNGSHFLMAYFGLSNVARFLSPFENQPGPPYYYIPIIIVGFFPFVAFVPQAIARAWRARSDNGRFLIAAAAVPLLFFSIAQTKLPNYIAIAFPVLAVMVGEALGESIARRSILPLRASLLVLVIALVLLVTGIVVYGRLHDSAQLAALVPSLSLLGWLTVPIALATFAAAMWWKQPWIVPVGLSLMMGAFIAVVALSILPDIEARSKPMKAMAADVMRYWHPGDRICFDGVRQGFSLDYYTNGPPITSVGHNVDDVPPRKYFAVDQPAVCVVSPDAYRDLVNRGVRMRLVEQTPTLWLMTTR
jgi:4-amino-4-deoxy-L-arabinose transferase-like glycosyltransferase